MKYKHIVFVLVVMFSSLGEVAAQQPPLKEAFKGKFLIGTAINTFQSSEKDTLSCQIIKAQFNSIVAENCMKSEVIHPQEDKFDFTQADQFVDFGLRNHMYLIGHTLIWHSQAPAWFFVDNQGNDVSREVLIQRMKTHIFTVMQRYKGKIKGWDVVNEAIQDDGSYRNSKFYQIIGKDYVKLAFQFAHEADPEAELYYNDYSMANVGRRNGVVKMIKELQNEGIKVSGIGMQCHIGLQYPDIQEFEKSVEAFAALGVKVMITEMDITVLPLPRANVGADVATNFEYQKSLNPYTESLPDSVNQALANRYIEFFKLFLRHQSQISRVTVWGVYDGQSWKNNWPVRGRTDYPLLYDRNFNPKPFVKEIINQALKN
jgi:endo-1,4-beta-xylanase